MFLCVCFYNKNVGSTFFIPAQVTNLCITHVLTYMKTVFDFLHLLWLRLMVPITFYFILI